MTDQNAARSQYGCGRPDDAASAQYKECQGRPLGREQGVPHEHPHTGLVIAPVIVAGLVLAVVGAALRRRTR